jgi:hypothetical protein
MISAEHARVRPLVIEFVGAPGAGKSSLLAAVSEACSAAGLSAERVVDCARELASRTALGRIGALLPEGRARSGILWVVFRWTSFAAAARHIVVTWPLAWRVLVSQRRRPAAAETGDRRVLYWLHRLAGAHALFLRHARPGEILLLDEGYAHRAVQLFASAVERPDPVAVTRYLDAVPVPDLLVVVRAASETCAERVLARGVWDRFAGRDETVLRRFVDNAHHATELAATYAIDRCWEVIEVENRSGALDATRTALGDAVTARLVGVGAS